MSEHSVGISLPLDSDGFLRRECPTCEREFKWLHSEAEGSEEMAEEAQPGGYFCPYCAVQGPDDSWWTKSQIGFMETVGARELVGPLVERLGQGARRLGDSSGGLIQARVEADLPDEPEQLTEEDDMSRVDFSCHSSEPVKVLDDWDQTVH